MGIKIFDGNQNIKEIYIKDSLGNPQKITKGFIRDIDGSDKQFYSDSHYFVKNGVLENPTSSLGTGLWVQQEGYIYATPYPGYFYTIFASNFNVTPFSKLSIEYLTSNYTGIHNPVIGLSDNSTTWTQQPLIRKQLALSTVKVTSEFDISLYNGNYDITMNFYTEGAINRYFYVYNMWVE